MVKMMKYGIIMRETKTMAKMTFHGQMKKMLISSRNHRNNMKNSKMTSVQIIRMTLHVKTIMKMVKTTE